MGDRRVKYEMVGDLRRAKGGNWREREREKERGR